MDPRTDTSVLEVERAVRERYSKSARETEPALCCPIEYDPRYLKAIPQEVLDRDYGCGDPSAYVREGDVVLDLGSGGGKIAFIAAQIAGPTGRVIGVDMNDAMLDLARRASSEVAERIGFANVSFHRGRIQDLALDLDRMDAWLRDNPVRAAADISSFEDASDLLRREHPMIPDASVDIVVSNCVLNLVRESDKPKLIREIFRVLRPGGRIAISDIVSDEPVPDDLKADADLWSGCVSGAFQESEILGAMEEAGFYGIALDRWGPVPFRTVRGIEFRAVTITARKGKEGPCVEANQAVIYRGPWKQVEDDDRHVFRRGERAAVCAKTFRILTSEPYAAEIIAVPPGVEIPESDRKGFDCSRTAPRHPRETKGAEYAVTTEADAPCCAPGECC